MFLIRALFRLFLLPLKIAFAVVAATFRVGFKVGTAPVRVGARSARIIGFRGWLFFLVGLALGLLFAPGPGRALRARLRAILNAGVLTDAELADKVTFELAHAPRSWHLPQPQVEVEGARATLRGNVPDDEARDELLRVAAGVPGIAGVDGELVVDR